MTRWHLCTLLFAAGHVLGCGGPDFHAQLRTLVARGAYAEAVANTRREPALEKTLAEVVIEDAAHSTDPARRRRAFGELQLAGSRSRPVLERLTEASPELTRAYAWSALLQLGDASARAPLRELADSPDPELSALGYAALDPEGDRDRLLSALTQPNRERRAAAVRVLARSPMDPDVRGALEAVARHDPDPGVRAGAYAALGAQGPEAAPALERGLDDESEAVRVAAVHALSVAIREGCAADGCEAAGSLARLERDLGGVPTPETLATAAVLLKLTPSREPQRALAVFERALGAGDAAVRGRAAVLCRGLVDPGCPSAALRERVRVEPNVEVKLAAALALGPDDALGRVALAELAREPRTITAIEAASELAAAGDPAARAALIRALRHPDARVRVCALRAVARLIAGGSLSSADDDAIAARAAQQLADRDERVRTAAAAAILSAS